MMEKNIKDIAKMFLDTFLKDSSKDNILLETSYIVYKSLKNIELKNEKSYDSAILILESYINENNKNSSFIKENEKDILFLLWKIQQLLYVYEKKNLFVQEVSFLSGIIESSLEKVNALNNKEAIETNVYDFPNK